MSQYIKGHQLRVHTFTNNAYVYTNQNIIRTKKSQQNYNV